MDKEIKKNILIEEIAEIKNNLRVSEKFRDCDLYNMMTATTKELLKGKYILIYGQPKIGKTTLAAQFPKNIIYKFLDIKYVFF